MIYEYVCANRQCENVGVHVGVTKPVAEIDREEKCEKCSGVMERTFAVTANVNLGSVHKGYQFKDERPGIASTPLSGDQNVDYAYRCLNEACESCSKSVVITKPMTQSSREELCESCGQKMGRVYSFSYGWGKGSRPDSDRRKQQMIDAVDAGDYAKMEELQLNYDSSSRFFFDKNDSEKKAYKVEGKDIEREYEHQCDNSEC